MNRRRALIRCVRPRARRGEERAALKAFDTVEPKLQGRSGARAASIPRAAIAGAPTPPNARPRRRPARQAAALGWSGACEQFAAVLRNWPVREIERDVRLSDAQRVAFYELVTSSLKAADTLASACPADAALTPVGRMETMRKRLAAVRAATAAIRPALMHFYEALDQGQKVRFAGI
jgi:hypothetical protein